MSMHPDSAQMLYSRRIILRFLDVLIGVIELLLAARVILRALGANAGSAFVAWIYGTTDQLLLPFFGSFPSVALSGVYVIEFSTLFAMIVYAFLGWALIRLVAFVIDSVLRIE